MSYHMPAPSDTDRTARSYEPLNPESSAWKAANRFGFGTLFVSISLFVFAAALYFRT